MASNALLVCRNQSSLRLIAAALDEMNIEQEVCLSSAEAMELLVREHYSAVVVDFDLPAAVQVARLVHMAPPHQRPVVFAMIGATTEVSEVFQAGANFVFYKPLVSAQVLRALRAGRGFMRVDRRKAKRHKTEALAHLHFGNVNLPALVMDVSEEGISLQTSEPLAGPPKIKFRFTLPGTANAVAGTGEMLWSDEDGRSGMVFAELTAASRRNLKAWLGKHGAKRVAGRAPARVEKSRSVAAGAD